MPLFLFLYCSECHLLHLELFNDLAGVLALEGKGWDLLLENWGGGRLRKVTQHQPRQAIIVTETTDLLVEKNEVGMQRCVRCALALVLKGFDYLYLIFKILGFE